MIHYCVLVLATNLLCGITLRLCFTDCPPWVYYYTSCSGGYVWRPANLWRPQTT